MPFRIYNFVPMKGLTDIKEQEFTEVLEDIDEPFHLIVWNDEVNTFEWVIETLMEICKHSYEQAEQCAYIIHFKGKYAVKHGTYEDLKPMCDAITDRGIGATLETVPV
jgi:ATP-dependent Clp protease adaptor protein ClpS